MITNRFNSQLFDSFDDFQFIQDLTGQDMTAWGLDNRLAAAGLSFPVRDPICVDAYNLLADMVRAAFYAGYKVGRNPDLLILAQDDGGDGAA